MTWTTELPTENGWYWWRMNDEQPSIPLKILISDERPWVILHGGMALPASSYVGQWCKKPEEGE